MKSAASRASRSLAKNCGHALARTAAPIGITNPTLRSCGRLMSTSNTIAKQATFPGARTPLHSLVFCGVACTAAVMNNSAYAAAPGKLEEGELSSDVFQILTMARFVPPQLLLKTLMKISKLSEDSHKALELAFQNGVELITSVGLRSDSVQVRLESVRALANLASYPEAHPHIARCDCMKIVLQLCLERRVSLDMQRQAARLLQNLANCQDKESGTSTPALLELSPWVPVLTAWMVAKDAGLRSSAADALIGACEDQWVVSQLAKGTFLQELLVLVDRKTTTNDMRRKVAIIIMRVCESTTGSELILEKSKGWVQQLIEWTLCDDEEMRRNAINSLGHLSLNDAGATKVLQEWLAGTLVSWGENDADAKVQREIASIYLEKEEEKEEIFDIMPDAMGLLEPMQKFSQSEDKGLRVATARTLAHLSTKEEHKERILNHGGLKLLLRMGNSAENDVKVEIARVIANLSLSISHIEPKTSKYQFSRRNRVGNKVTVDGDEWNEVRKVVMEWSESEHFVLKSQARRALLNMEAKETKIRYEDGICIIREPEGPSGLHDVDIVFVHGIRGCAYTTWRIRDDSTKSVVGAGSGSDPKLAKEHVAEETIWPKSMLGQDLQASGVDSRILSIQYDADLGDWFQSRKPIEKNAVAMLEKLRNAGVGQHGRPVVFICHSMGGLLTKTMLVEAAENGDMDHGDLDIVHNTKAVVFYATPHRGVEMGKYAFALRPSKEYHDDLHPNAPNLLKLNESFIPVAQEHGISIVSYGEGEKTAMARGLATQIVPNESANPGVGEFLVAPANHIEICKPHGRDDETYKTTLEYVDRVLREAKTRRM